MDVEGRNVFIPLQNLFSSNCWPGTGLHIQDTPAGKPKDEQLKKVNAGASGEESGKGGNSRLAEIHI